MAIATGGTHPSSLGFVARQVLGEPNASGGGVTDAAGVTRAQWQHFLDTYRPVEDEVLRRAMDSDFTKEGDAAGQTAAAGVNASRGILARNLSRSGVSLSAEERAALSRRTGSTLTRAVARAENTTRRAGAENRSNLLRGIVNIGRGVATSATGGLQSVADMAAQRESLHQQQRAQASSTNLSAAASAAAMLIAFV
jgi:hypothetical protein